MQNKKLDRELDQAVGAMTRNFPQPMFLAFGYDIVSQNPGDGRRYRVVSHNGSREISPLLPAAEMKAWLRGFAAGQEERYEQIKTWVRQQEEAAHV